MPRIPRGRRAMASLLALILVFCSLALAGCDWWNPFSWGKVEIDASADIRAGLDPSTLERIDKVNETLDKGIEVGPETRSTIESLNQTLRDGAKVGLTQDTLQRVDSLLRVVEDGVHIGLDDATLGRIDNALKVLDNAPDKWKETGQEIASSLEKAAGTTAGRMGKEVKAVLEEAGTVTQQITAQMGVEFRCNVDFLSIRAGDTLDRFIGRTILGRLQDILHGKSTSPMKIPWICQVMPDQVSLVPMSGRMVAKDNIIRLTGFNYDDTNLPKVYVANETGQPIGEFRLFPMRTSSYQIQLNVQDLDFASVPARSKIVFEWPNAGISSMAVVFGPEALLPGVVIKTASAPIYAGPGAQYHQLGIAQKGATYTVHGRNGDTTWWQVDFNDQQGWVSADAADRTDNRPVPVASNIPVPPPTAQFSVDIGRGRAPLTVHFDDQSLGANKWLWDFGDGETSHEQEPSHTYRAIGTYTVRLTVSNEQGTNFAEKKALVVVVTPPAVPDFAANRVSGTAPLEVAFQDKSTNSPTSWFWQFGDGTTSPQRNPTHTYTAPGMYTVELTVKNSEGGSAVTRSGFIRVDPPSLVAKFTGEPRTGKVPLTVEFRDQSAGSPTGWLWKFGDGRTSTLANPVHEYTKPGSFTVELTVSNARGANSQSAAGYIVLPALPACVNTDFVSEEGDGPPASCPAGYAARGIRCRGGDCDDVSLFCCPYIDGRDTRAGWGWSQFFSEEQPNYRESSTGWVDSIRCRGSNCDDISLRFLTTPYLSNSRVCTWTEAVSEEQRDGAKCGTGWFVSGMRCTGDNCDNISLKCCKAE